MKNLTVSDLRSSGNKVRVQHQRLYYGTDTPMTRGQYEEVLSGVREFPKADVLVSPYSEGVNPNGGVTIVQVTTPDGTELEGIAKCSVKDPYNRKRGLSIALGRALNGQNSQ